MKVVIDPGHSGPVEPGACARGVRECDVVLAIAKLLAEQLYEQGYEALLTRNGNIESDGLLFRSELANANQADLFISIHANSATNHAAHGTEVYHYPGSEQGQRLARLIQSQLVAELKTADRGVKEANFRVLRETECPAVLVEVAFISNEKNRELLTRYICQLGAAIAIAGGINRYFAG